MSIEELAARLRIVMVETSHPGNIGAAARAMKNMGLSRLYLVAPRHFPDDEATARASGADELLAQAVCCETLAEALEGCSRVYGASARSLRAIPWPQVDARRCAEEVVGQGGGEVALLFGRERSGLTNQELELCHALLHIPTNPAYSSLNVAAAIQVVAYELRMAAEGAWEATPSNKEDRPASADEVDGLIAHLEQSLQGVGFLDPANPRQLMRRLRRLFNRAELEKTEVNILRGYLAAVDTLVAKLRNRQGEKSD